MKITPEHGRETSSKIFLNVEYADPTPGERGELVVFDITDNRSEPGIMQETRGLRVLLHTLDSFEDQTGAGVLETDVAAMPPKDSVTGNYRGQMVLAQCFGYHDGAQYAGSSQAIGEGYIVPHNGQDGKMSARSAGSITGPVAVAYVGFNAEVATGDFLPKGLFIKMMG